MTTGKMKHIINIPLFLLLTTLKTTAQFTAGMIALSATNTNAAPVDLKMQAAIANNTGEISWTAFRQVKVRRYELEKSTDGEIFAYVTAVAGNTRGNVNYTVQDRNLVESVNYYRLKIVAADGNFHYSRTVALDANSKPVEIKILPTQIDQKLFIWVPANTSISNASISDASGRNIVQHTHVNNTTNLADVEISRLPVGLYHIQLLTNKGETVKLKFSKGS